MSGGSRCLSLLEPHLKTGLFVGIDDAVFVAVFGYYLAKIAEYLTIKYRLPIGFAKQANHFLRRHSQLDRLHIGLCTAGREDNESHQDDGARRDPEMWSFRYHGRDLRRS